jgi:DNA-directed RNA polymerase specialized sigma24 family protein
MLPDDALLVKWVLTGEQSAFGPLIDRYWPRVMQLALRRLGSVTHAEVVVQDAFLQALVGLRTLRADDRFAPWLLVKSNCKTNKTSSRRSIPAIN